MLTQTVSHAHWILALMSSCSGRSLFLLIVLQPFSLWLLFAADWNQRAGRFGLWRTPLWKPAGCVCIPIVEGLLCTEGSSLLWECSKASMSGNFRLNSLGGRLLYVWWRCLKEFQDRESKGGMIAQDFSGTESKDRL